MDEVVTTGEGYEYDSESISNDDSDTETFDSQPGPSRHPDAERETDSTDLIVCVMHNAVICPDKLYQP